MAGNGGSAAEAQHLAGELVGRFDGERLPLPAIALHADTSAITAIGNDYGYDEVFARQVRAHGRPGDVLVLLSTSGRSANLLAAAEVGMVTWALTGAAPNPLAGACDDALAVPSPDQQTVQELHLVSVHLLCAHLEAALPGTPVRRRHLRLERGGAALAATFLALDGVDVVLVGAIGADEAGDAVRGLLAALGVSLVEIPYDGPTRTGRRRWSCSDSSPRRAGGHRPMARTWPCGGPRWLRSQWRRC